MRKIFLLSAIALSGILCLQGCAQPQNNSITEQDQAAVTPAESQEQSGFSPAEAFEKTLCSADDALNWAKSQPVVVMQDAQCTAGKEVWQQFYETANAGKPASVLCANYYTLDNQNIAPELYEAEKDNYPQLFFSLIEYDGKEYTLKARMSSETTLDLSRTYQYLVHFEEQNPDGAVYKYTDEYDLMDDPSVTWEQLQQSMFSSSSLEWIRFNTVYCDSHD